MFRSISRKIGILALVALAAFGASAAASAGSAQAASIVTLVRVCDQYGNTPMNRLSPAAATLTTWCLINRERKAAGVGYESINKQLDTSSMGHAQRSVQGHWWSLTDGSVSHHDPLTGTDPLQRMQAAGYCSGGSSYRVGEITYAGTGSGSTPKAAVAWWMSDPPHRAALLDPGYKQMGAAGINGSPFNPPATGVSGTYVVDFGLCT